MRKIASLLCLAIVAAGCGTRRPAASTPTKSLEEKYALMLGVDRANISNKRLYSFIDEWYRAPYQYAGKTKKGVDCSGFTSVLLAEIYGKQMSGSSASIYKQCREIARSELQEGDLVFFKIDSKDISHVGVYLQNNKFVHATTKAGVMIDDLGSEYYKKYFSGSGSTR